jgi:predicted SnoaL-like aldol condensation-catalyzing enzyme
MMIKEVANKCIVGLMFFASLTGTGRAAAQVPGSSAPSNAPGQLQTTEARNRALIISLYYNFYNNHDLNYPNQIVLENYIQHNPSLATGRAAFVSFFQSIFSQYPQFRSEIVRMAAEGDLVFVHGHQTTSPSDLGVDAVDIYRIQDGKIVEHWDATENVPASSANDNGIF